MSWTDEEEECAVVVDNGSYSVKSGLAGEDSPKSIVPSMIGYVANSNYNEHHSNKPVCNGVKYVIDHGIITSMEDMETVWYHSFYNELNIDPSTVNILLTDSPLNPKSNREIMIQSMFETFGCPATYISNQGTLALYASGRTTGITLGVGHGVTACVPIWEGYAMPSAVRRSNFCGAAITNYLMQLLKHKGYRLSTSMEREIVRDLKEKQCYIAMDYEEEVDKWESSVGTKGIDKKYELPDGKEINVNIERFKSTELLFKPDLIHIDSVGIHKLLHESIVTSDIDTRRDLCGNIVIFGSTTMLHGFEQRLEKEVKTLTKNCKVRVVAPPERGMSAWIGGSILASLSTFQEMWIVEQEYDEHGVNIVHRKCLSV